MMVNVVVDRMVNRVMYYRIVVSVIAGGQDDGRGGRHGPVPASFTHVSHSPPDGSCFTLSFLFLHKVCHLILFSSSFLLSNRLLAPLVSLIVSYSSSSADHSRHAVI